VKDELGNPEFIKKSFSSDFCTGLVHSVHLRRKLHDILRVLTVPIPIRVGGKLAYPRPGYDARFGTFLVDGAPTIKEMPLEKALRILQKIHAEFCFTNDGKEQSGQSRTHAIARLLTPFARGILGWTTRVPLWFYFANRPRAGKDYLAAIPLLVYQGHAFEDLPIGKDSEETAKRIVAAARNGRHFMHFSNCQGYLGDQYFCQIITATGIGGRSLGANAAASDLLLPNEMEFSLSANVGLSYHEDFEPRMRKIELAYYGQDPNARVFQNKFLHQDIKEHRGDTLSAIAAVFRNWEKKGFPNGATPFISFPQWAEVVGGVMTATKDLGDHALGDPCLPFKGEYDDVGGDRLTEAMTQLFRVCRAEFGDRKVFKKDIYKCVHEAAMNEEGGNDALAYFGDLEDSEDARKNQTRLGINLTKFKNRELSGITLLVDASLANSVKHTYRFFEALAREPVNLCEPLAELRVTRETSDELKSVPRVEQKNENDLHAHNLKSPPEVHAGSQVHGSEDPPADLSSPTLAVDIETYTEIRTGKNGKILRSKDALNAQKGEIRLLSIADASGGISLRDLRESPISPEEREIIESRDELILHNAGFDLRFLGAKLGIFPQRVFDTFTAAWLLSPRKERIHDLGSVLERHLEIKIPKGQGASDWGGMLLTDEQIAYAKDDVRFLHRLKDRLVKELEAMKLGAVFEMESRLLPIIAGMETRGFAVDTDRMRKLKEAADHNAGTLAAALRKDFGAEGLNPASPQELLEAFKKDGIELEDTSEETLCALEDPRAQTILRWRAETKLSSNCKTLLGAEHQGRIYARFDALGTVTGRFSSKSPNLQNVTRGPLRSCFIPSGPDRRLIVADYSQIELRVAALIAKETVMIDAFKTKADLHKMTAAAVLRKPVGEVAKDDRQMAKAVSFGFLYGQSANGFVAYARANYGLNLSLEDAERFRENFFFTYPAFRRWHIACKRKAVNSDNGSARTVFGRLLMARKDDAWARFNMFTEYVVSGSCADLLKMAMIKVAAVVPADVHPVATIHDELVYDAPADTAKQYCSVIRQAMEDAFTEMFGKVVPVEVEAKVCGNWGEK
jgi:DNA polymerase-1